MKKVTIINAYGDKNIGDAAILNMAITLTNEAQKDNCTISILCEDIDSFSNFIHPAENTKPFQLPYGYAIRGKERVSSPTKLLRFFGIFLKSYSYIFLHNTFNKPLPTKGFYSYIKEIKQADLIVGMGGGYLTTNDKYKDYFGLGLTLLPMYIAKMYKKRLLLLPMSFGPFASEAQKNMAYDAVKDTTIISRDHITLSQLQEVDTYNKLTTYYSPDLALHFKNKEIPLKKKLASDYIVLTAREWFTEKEKQDAYEKSLVKFIDTVWKDFKLKIIFIPMARNVIEDDDNRVAKRIQQQVTDKKSFSIFAPQSLSEVQDALGNAKLAICTRMHSAILSTTVHTPFIAIGYGHKTLGFVKSFGIEKWHTDIHDVTFDDLYKKYLALSEKENYLEFISLVKKKQTDIKKYRSNILKELAI